MYDIYNYVGKKVTCRGLGNRIYTVYEDISVDYKTNTSKLYLRDMQTEKYIHVPIKDLILGYDLI